MIDLIEQVRKVYSLPPVDYCFFNTGLEMDATKRHVRETAQKYSREEIQALKRFRALPFALLICL